MRTQEEINRQIEGLQERRENVPEFNFFGGDNYAKIDAQISVLENKSTPEDYQDYDIELGAYIAYIWLEEEDDEDLFD